MIREFKGTSQLAMLADALPVRARVCLALLAAELGLHHLQSSPDFRLARDALAMVLSWHQGERVDLDRLEHRLDAEETSLSFASMRAEARSAGEYRAWHVLANAIDYVGYHAFRAADRDPWSALGNIDERVLDSLDKDLRALEPSSMALMTRAAAYLKQHPDVRVARLKAHLLRGDRIGL
jgi:hypothetical protein